jgi:hypothetical protein
MSVKHLAMALAISLGAGSLAVAQTASNPPSGSMGTNDTMNNHGTLNTNEKGGTTTTGSTMQPSERIMSSNQATDASHATGHVTKSRRTHTARVVRKMSNGTAINSGKPAVPVKANGGG